MENATEKKIKDNLYTSKKRYYLGVLLSPSYIPCTRISRPLPSAPPSTPPTTASVPRQLSAMTRIPRRKTVPTPLKLAAPKRLKLPYITTNAAQLPTRQRKNKSVRQGNKKLPTKFRKQRKILHRTSPTPQKKPPTATPPPPRPAQRPSPRTPLRPRQFRGPPRPLSKQNNAQRKRKAPPAAQPKQNSLPPLMLQLPQFLQFPTNTSTCLPTK